MARHEMRKTFETVDRSVVGFLRFQWLKIPLEFLLKKIYQFRRNEIVEKNQYGITHGEV